MRNFQLPKTHNSRTNFVALDSRIRKAESALHRFGGGDLELEHAVGVQVMDVVQLVLQARVEIYNVERTQIIACEIGEPLQQQFLGMGN